ncbi:MAG: maltose alpha-D-glucosyltransferase [Caldilineaceae bacterium]|nr:maltose alpha-D-glucosyltransferase [Caldilineaceae bacterium]
MTEQSHWYKDAIFYELYVRAFADGNGDGNGDFRGLITKLDYIQSLGVDCIWLLPMYPSPLVDDGYDIAGYFDIHRDYGTLDDFKAFLEAAHARGLRVITDLVLNHTSDQHPWFQASRNSRVDAKRDYYVWSDTDEKYPEVRIIFLDTEPSNWTLDERTGQYFWHRFYKEQPDLNYDNPEVQAAMLDVMSFWLDMGIDGFRADAVPYLFEREGTNGENLPETHAYLKRVRAYLDQHYSDRILLAEANQWPEEVVEYFGTGEDEFHMGFHFPVMPRLYMALRQGDRTPVVEIMRHTPPIPDGCQWCMFLRNHDELTLEMVTEEERQWMWQEYAPDPRMRLNLGIRRRLAPLVDNDRRRIELLNSLLFTLPGAPIVYYGDEIGMGDNIWLHDRNGVRTPMQWNDGPNAGFSNAPADKLYAPIIDDPTYGYKRINVAGQEADATSLLDTMRHMIHTRKESLVFSRGVLEFLEPEDTAILAYLRRYQDEVVLAVHNLVDEERRTALNLYSYAGAAPYDLLAGATLPIIGHSPYEVDLPPYGYRWLKLA